MWSCPNCREQIEDEFDTCWKCGTGKDGSKPSPDFKQTAEEDYRDYLETDHAGSFLSSRYPALTIIAWCYKVLAWLTGGLYVIAIFYVAAHAPGHGVLLVLGLIVFGTAAVITLLAISEGIRVFLDIEENTRIARRRKRRH